MMRPKFSGKILPMFLRRGAAVYFSLLMVLFSYGFCSAGPNEEIAHLLSFVAQSGCTFIRNGTKYDAPAAREHIAKKYAFFKERISTAEDFVEYSATKSSMTGEPYHVVCNNVDMKSSDWLLAELDQFRTTIPEENHETPHNNSDD